MHINLVEFYPLKCFALPISFMREKEREKRANFCSEREEHVSCQRRVAKWCIISQALTIPIKKLFKM